MANEQILIKDEVRIQDTLEQETKRVSMSSFDYELHSVDKLGAPSRLW